MNSNITNSALGINLGQRGRNSRTYEIFWSKKSDSKSGKAEKGRLTVVIHPYEVGSHKREKYTYVEGVTYLPKFAIQDQALDWIIEEKLANYSHWDTSMFIMTGAYGITYGERISGVEYSSDKSPQQKHEDFLNFERQLTCEYILPQVTGGSQN